MSTTPLRADAQRNLERVLDAAAELFAERGCDVSVDEIARKAGVGHATVFRRFPSKEALISAVVSKQIHELTAFVEEALDEEDPGEAFRSFVWHAGEMHARDRGLHEGFTRCADVGDVAEAKAELNGLIDQLIARAQDAGALGRTCPRTTSRHSSGLRSEARTAPRSPSSGGATSRSYSTA